MAFIEISNLNTADSFLTELEKTDTVQIFGGRNRGGSSSRSIVPPTPTPTPAPAHCCKCPATTPPPEHSGGEPVSFAGGRGRGRGRG
jgi:hypothetical protein